jgi:ATP-dependent Clp protease ATP-binding subunit ClpA
MHAFYDRVTDRARQALEFANNLALRRKHPLVTNLHILWGIMEEGRNVGSKVLEEMKVDSKKLKLEIEAQLGYGEYATHDRAVCYAEDARQCICEAITLGQSGMRVIGCHHLLQAILMEPTNPAAQLLDKWKVTQELTDAYMGAVVKPVS